jgi:hypothetical protein
MHALVLLVPTTLFVWLISHQPTVLFSQNKPAISNQSAVLFYQNKPAPVISHQPNEHAAHHTSSSGQLAWFCMQLHCMCAHLY